MNIRLSSEDKIKVLNTKDLYVILQKILKRDNKIDRDKEHFWVIGLAANNTLEYIELVSLGNLDSAIVTPREVFRLAIQKGTARIILAHNHPSGEMRPSHHDLDITDQLIQVGHITGIPVLDHFIISLKDYFSFAEHGLIHTLESGSSYIPKYQQDKIKLDAKKNAEDQRTRELAKRMKDKGIDIEVIVEISGLTEKEIGKL